MKFNAPTYDLPAEGLHNAVCIRIIDLGTQTGSYQGKTTHAKKVMLTFELIDEGRPTGKNFIVSKIYTASLHIKSTLRKDIDSWRGQPMSALQATDFETSWMAGRPCQILIQHVLSGDAERAAIDRILPAAMSVATPATHLEVLTFDLGAPDPEVFLALSDGVRRMIESSPEWRTCSLAKRKPANDLCDSYRLAV